MNKKTKKIKTALEGFFKKHRIVFWFDQKSELSEEFDSLELPDVEKVKVDNNEFALKHRILREEPEKQFLVLRSGKPPKDLENWLLDIELASGRFEADRESIVLSELELPYEMLPVIREHLDFFRSGKRIDALKDLLDDGEQRQVSASALRMKMLAVTLNCAENVEEFVWQLLDDFSQDKNDLPNEMKRFNLYDYLFREISSFLGYEAKNPSVSDLAFWLFSSLSQYIKGESERLSSSILSFMNRWKGMSGNREAFRILSKRYEDLLKVDDFLHACDYSKVIEYDYFRGFDRKIITSLIEALQNRTISYSDCMAVIERRKITFWYDEFEGIYTAIASAAEFFELYSSMNYEISSPEQALESYSDNWYKIDATYRRFCRSVRARNLFDLFEVLKDKIDRLYTFQFLPEINDGFQKSLSDRKEWQFPGLARQSDFFEKEVKPFYDANKKVVVVISDALRYEAAREFFQKMLMENRFNGRSGFAVSSLPSVTMLGMASLLPHEELSFIVKEMGGVDVLCDGLPTAGIENRNKILRNAIEKSSCFKYEEIAAYNSQQCKEIIKANQVIYIFHNRIDSVGDARETELRTFEAVEDSIDELKELLKKLGNANASNFLLTADHGFLYQETAIEPSDFTADEPAGKEIIAKSPRYAVGRELVETPGVMKLTSQALNLKGDLEFVFPKSINRFHKRGAGQRFVHGGATLQEIALPVIRLNKRRQSDISKVDVDILRGTSNNITTGQFSVSFYQLDPCSEKVQPRTLRAGLYTAEGELISDSHLLVFDSSSDESKSREQRVRFILSKRADEMNKQQVYLRLYDKVSGTERFVEYKYAVYYLMRSFSTDFDF